MTKAKKLSKRQLDVIEDLFSGELTEQSILDKYNISINLYNKWLFDDAFIEQFDKYITRKHRQSAALIASHAPFAAARLVQLTESDKPETARKACLDIISMHSPGDSMAGSTVIPVENFISAPNEPPALSNETAGKLLAVLADDRQSQ